MFSFICVFLLILPVIHGYGFTAKVSKANHYSSNQTIVFDHVITNEGYGYNDKTGVFTAPKSGLYAFTVTIQVYEAWATVNLMKGNELIGRVYPYDYTVPYQADASTITVTTKLKKSDVVFVKYTGGVTLRGYIPSLDDSCVNYFSGFLVSDYAFTATISKANHYQNNQTIIFDRVITNEGNSYNATSGAFFVPKTGMYVFAITLRAYGGHAWAHLIREWNDPYAYTRAYQPDTGIYRADISYNAGISPNKADTSAFTAIVKANKCDAIFVEYQGGVSKIKASLDDGFVSYFSGFRVSGYAFTAVIPKNKHYCVGEIIKFTNVVSNEGNAYNATTGKFTAPTQGLYAFTVTMLVYGARAYVFLVKGQEQIGHVHASDYNRPFQYKASSATITTTLNQGDIVFARFGIGSTQTTSSLFHCSFAGFQVS